MGDYIQEDQSAGPLGRVTATFRFLRDPYRRTLADRWEDLVRRIRQFLARFPDNTPLNINMTSRTGMGTSRLLRNGGVLTAEFLIGFFEYLLHSNETLELESVDISVTVIDRMPDSRVIGRGSGRTHGFNLLPDELKNMGLMVHKDTKDYVDELFAEGLCGIRAALFCRDTEELVKKPLTFMRIKSIEIADRLGLENGSQSHYDFSRLLELQDWRHLRIVLFGETGAELLQYSGDEWQRSHEDLKIPDTNTLHIMHYSKEQHYYSIQNINRFLTKTRKGKVCCFGCYRLFSTENMFAQHTCKGRHICSMCHQSFEFAAYEQHMAMKRHDLECPRCDATMFFGSSCHEIHMKNKKCPVPKKPFAKCDTCGKQQKVNHECYFKRCGACLKSLPTKEAYKEHYCSWTRQSNRFYKNFSKDKEGNYTKWHSHWFYDFETCRQPTDVENIYRHEVMAWACQLMIPDHEVGEFVRDTEYLVSVEELVQSNSDSLPFVETVLQDHAQGGTILVYGREIGTFMKFLWLITHEQSIKQMPVLWAHNGSKFDVKFIMQYYYHEKGYQISGFEMNGDEVDKRNYKKYLKKNKLQNGTLKMQNIGSKVIGLQVDDIDFRCSLSHFACELRKVPKMLGVEAQVAKGEFPYRRLAHDAWDSVHSLGLPPLEEYEPNSRTYARRQEIIGWWVQEQQKRNVPRSTIAGHLQSFDDTEEFLESLNQYQPAPNSQIIEWNFNEELKKYLFADVNVGALCLEKYHQTSIEMHEKIFALKPDAERKVVSPLGLKTAASWALAIYTHCFLPEDTLGHLPVQTAKDIRACLRGGRTDKRANIVSVTDEQYAKGDRIVYVDFKSLYPSVQKTSVHGTHFPVGRAYHIREIHPDGNQICNVPDPEQTYPHRGSTNNEILLKVMKDWTGFLDIKAERIKYSTHPTLSTLGSRTPDKTKKLLFENTDLDGMYAWPEIEEAILSGEINVEVVFSGHLFKKGENVFSEYVDFFFAMKQEAEDNGNGGLRELAKLLLNSLWGKLGQRTYPIQEWVNDLARLDTIIRNIDNKTWELKSIVHDLCDRVYIEYIETDTLTNIKTTNVQMAAFVSMWGRVMLHRKVLQPHGQRALYCDTDSGIIYLRGGTQDREKLEQYCGDKIGDLCDEVAKLVKGQNFQEPYIREAVFVAPKTYALEIVDAQDKSKVYHKTVCKGFESSYAGSQYVNFQSMKNLVNDKYKITQRLNDDRTIASPVKRLEGVPRLQFVSGTFPTNVNPIERTITKNIAGEYTKGTVHPTDPRLIIPFGDLVPDYSFLHDLENNVLLEHYD